MVTNGEVNGGKRGRIDRIERQVNAHLFCIHFAHTVVYVTHIHKLSNRVKIRLIGRFTGRTGHVGYGELREANCESQLQAANL